MTSAVANTTRTNPLAKLPGLGRSAWAVADQMLISGTNFVTMILLARGLESTAAFGAFVLVYSVLFFANSFQSNLVTQPHNVLGATRHGSDYVHYTTSAALLQVIIIFLAVLLTLMGWGISRAIGWNESSLLLAMIPALIAWQLQEFMRRVLYTERRILMAFVVDLLGYGGQVLAITYLWWQGGLSGTLAFYVIAGASALGALFGAWQLRSSLSGKWEIHSAIENWHFGKWLAGGEIIGNWGAGQFLMYLAAAILGAWSAGVLRAVQTIFGPLRILVQAFGTSVPTRFARTLATRGEDKFRKEVRIAFLIAVPILASYCLLIALLAGFILTFAFGDKYAGNERVLMLYALNAFLGYLNMLLTATLRSTRTTKPIFNSSLLVACTVVPLSGLLIPIWGIYGVVAGMIAANLILVVLYYRTYQLPLRLSLPDAVEPALRNQTEAENAHAGGSPARKYYHLNKTERGPVVSNDMVGSQHQLSPLAQRNK